MRNPLPGYVFLHQRRVIGWRTRYIEQYLDVLSDFDGDIHRLVRATSARQRAKRRANVEFNFGHGRAKHLENSRRQYERDIARCREEYDAFKRRWEVLVPSRPCIGMDRFRRFHRQAFRHDGDLVISRIVQSEQFARRAPECWGRDGNRR